jgi:hypothetical protein
MNTRIVIAVVALTIAFISGAAFMRVLGRIIQQGHFGRGPKAHVESTGWHLLHSPTRLILRQYRIAQPTGTLDRHLYAYYLIGGTAAIVFFADVLTLLAGK